MFHGKYSTPGAPKNASPKNGQAGVSRFFKNIPGWKVEDKSKFGKDVVLQHILDTKFVRCTAFMTADKNVNRLELRKLRTTLGCDAGLHVLRRPGVL